jgi:photosystem II stability/assembly factor-like uncharacterized protein
MSMLLACSGGTAVQAGPWAPFGPQGGTALSLARHPTSPNVVLAGAYFGGLYRSVDEGFSWTTVATPFASSAVFAVTFDPGDPTVIYAGTFQHGLFRTHDGGLTWVPVGEGLTDQDVQAVAVDPFDSTHVLAAGGQGGVFESRDSGGRFARMDGVLRNTRAQAVAFDPARPGVVLVGTIGTGMWATQDGGVTWDSSGTALLGRSVLSVAFGGPEPSYAYAATDQGVFRRDAAAPAWTDISRNLPAVPVNQVLPHPALPGAVYALSGLGVYFLADDGGAGDWEVLGTQRARVASIDPRGSVLLVGLEHGGLVGTRNGGQDWLRADRGMQNFFVGSVTVSPATTPALVHAGTDLGVMSGTGPTSWRSSLEAELAVYDIAIPPGRPEVLYAALERGGVWKSADVGSTWTLASSGLLPRDVLSLDQSPVDPGFALAGTTSGLFVSRDGAASWRPSSAVNLLVVTSVAVDPVRAPIAYAGGLQGQVVVSLDGGASFHPASEGLPAAPIIRLKVAPWEKTYAITATGELFATSDRGLRWFPAHAGVAEPVLSLDIDPQHNWVLYAGTAGGGVYRSESAALDWKPANVGLGSLFVTSLWVDRREPASVLAATADGFYRTRDGGATWVRLAAAGMPENEVVELVGDAQGGSALFARVQDGAIYRSLDGGASWETASQGLPSSSASPMPAGGSLGGTLLTGSRWHGVYRSVDQGASWQAASHGMNVFVRSLAIDPRDAETVYAGTIDAGIFKSTDAGLTWEPAGLSRYPVFKVAVDPENGQRLFAATGRGLHRSDDGASTWYQPEQCAMWVFSLAVNPSRRTTLLVGSAAGEMCRSNDAGYTWETVGAGLPWVNVLALVWLPGGDEVVAATDRAGIYRSTDAGTTWSRAADTSLRGEQVTRLSLDPVSGLLYAATNHSGAYLSVDRGASWVSVPTGLGGVIVSDFGFDPSRPWTVLASTKDAGVFSSSDAGLHWAPASAGLGTSQVNALARGPVDTWFAATAAGIYRSTDAGAMWQTSGLGGVEVLSLWIDPSSPQRLFAGTSTEGLYATVDGGDSWTRLLTPSPALLGIPYVAGGATSDMVYLGTLGGGVLLSVDGGANWSSPIDASLAQGLMTTLVVGARQGNAIYAGTAGRGVLRSDSLGFAWREVDDGLDQRFITCLAMDPSSPTTVYAGTSGGGVYVTRDGGRGWVSANDGLLHLNVTSLYFDDTHRTLYAGTEGGGLFRNVQP